MVAGRLRSRPLGRRSMLNTRPGEQPLPSPHAATTTAQEAARRLTAAPWGREEGPCLLGAEERPRRRSGACPTSLTLPPSTGHPGVPLEDFDFDASDVAAYGAAAKEQLQAQRAAAQRAARPARVPRRHYEAWLDYVYYSSEGLRLVAYQEPMTEEQAQLVYKDGDALPNAWHPSDHLPVGCVFELL